MSAQRRLAAILAADVVGYARMMQDDETGTLDRLKGLWRDILLPAAKRHRGRVVKVLGDGVLLEFASAVDAVECARCNRALRTPTGTRPAQTPSGCASASTWAT
jgi:class 3 adenylate cyclase